MCTSSIYSGDESWLSESRQAEILRRRQIQQRPSFEVGDDISLPHAVHFTTRCFPLSNEIEALAASEISFATTGSEELLLGLRFKMDNLVTPL